MALMRTLTALILIQAVLGKSGWSYDAKSGDGPEHWKDACNGKIQSPIDIKTGGPGRRPETRAVRMAALSLQDYDVLPEDSKLNNNGHAVKLTNIYGSGPTPELSGAGLPANYKFAQVHFHWGEDSSRGSEHTINGQAFPMEMHLVHFQADLHNISEAREKDNLAVLGIFFKISTRPHPGIEKLLPHLTAVREVGSVSVPVFPLADLLPQDLTEVFRYSGSLTTPPCSQIVQWTLLKKPVDITEGQMAKFRELLTEGKKPLVNNYRPTQQLNSRKVQFGNTEPTVRSSSRHPSTSSTSSTTSSSSSSSSLHFTVTLLVISSLSVVLGNNN